MTILSTPLRDEEIPHDTLFDVLHRKLIDAVGEERAIYEIAPIFADVTKQPLLPVNFEDPDIQSGWDRFKEEARLLDYDSRLEMFEEMGLMGSIGKMPPFYTFLEHRDYWQQHPDIKAVFSFDASAMQPYNFEFFHQEFPIPAQFDDLLASAKTDYNKAVHNMMIQTNQRYDIGYNLEPVYRTVAVQNSDSAHKRLVQADMNSPSGNTFAVIEEMDDLPPSQRNKGIARLLEEGNDLIAVYHHFGEELSHYSQLIGVFGYKERSEGILELTGAWQERGYPSLSQSVMEKMEAIAKEKNQMILVSDAVSVPFQTYFPSSGKITSHGAMLGAVAKNLHDFLNNHDYAETDDVLYRIRDAVSEISKNTLFGQIFEKWEYERESGVSARVFIEENKGLVYDRFHLLNTEGILENTELKNKINDTMTAYPQEEWYAHITDSLECKNALWDISNKLEAFAFQKPKSPENTPTMKP